MTYILGTQPTHVEFVSCSPRTYRANQALPPALDPSASPQKPLASMDLSVFAGLDGLILFLGHHGTAVKANGSSDRHIQGLLPMGLSNSQVSIGALEQTRTQTLPFMTHHPSAGMGQSTQGHQLVQVLTLV
jgi:hypothetical protein